MLEGSSPSSLTDPLVMVIEDDPDSGMLLEELLHEAHLRTIWYRDGAQALNALDACAEVPNLILLDLHMPNMDGWTFRVEQRRRSHLKDIPVAVMTADGSSMAQAIDADLLLPKPLSSQRLIAAVQEVLLTVERRKLLAASFELERLRSLGVLLGSVVHELSTPLQVTSGFLEVAQRECVRIGEAAAAVLRPIEAALTASAGLREIVKDLRIFSRVESGEATADVVQALQSAIRLSEPGLRGKATLRAVWPPSLPKVIGNEARLSQVFLNLLSNASQAIADRAGSVNSVVVTVSEAPKQIIVEVADTGVGMTPEVLQSAFDPFFTTKSAAEGTGIGLSFCKQTIEGYNGSITATSEPGKGSTFRVQLWRA